MKKKKVITTETREVWVIRQPGLASEQETKRRAGTVKKREKQRDPGADEDGGRDQ